MNKEIEIYAKGIVACSVCVPKEMKKPDIMAAVNLENPTGIESEWIITQDDFANGAPNGKTCEDDENRKHYLLNC